MSIQTKEYDTIVIGGGPAGSTTAALLAQRGWRVALLEKDRFPRYHVGESLMPYCYYPLERLGLVDRMKQSKFPKKYSVQFVTTDGKSSAPFYFFQHLKHEAATTWQVHRDEFDQMLLDNAQDKGAAIYQETAAKALIHEGDDSDGAVIGVTAKDKAGETLTFRAPMTVDATGRDAFSINRHDWRMPDPKLKKVAVWTYYKGAKRDCGLDEHATTVAYLPEKGWFWFIPLPDDVVSVGIVAERDYLYRGGLKGDPKAIFEREIQENAWIKDHLSTGEQYGQYWVTGDYSYRSKYCATDGLVLVGDAFAFLDPVFSSGVFLALRSGELAADTIDQALVDRDFSASRFGDYSETLCQGIEAMRKLVYAFYEHDFSFGQAIRKNMDVRPDLTDCLIGHLFRDFDDLFDAVGEFAELPTPLAHGRPKPAAEPALAMA